MPELSKYGFRSDKAKEPFADETTFEAVKKLALDFEMYQLAKAPIAANNTYVWTIKAPANSLPMPQLELMTARKQTNPSSSLSIVKSNIITYVWLSGVYGDSEYGRDMRNIVVFIFNGNDFPIYVWANAQVLVRTYGDNFPRGNAWPAPEL